MEPKTTRRRPNEIAGEDYAEEMFKDGHDRADEDPTVRDAPRYDEAAHRGSRTAPFSVNLPSSPHQTSPSRDGTESAGEYDESGGPLGGSEEELDEMEAAGRPVDRQSRMKG